MTGVNDARGRLFQESLDRIYDAAFDRLAFANLSSVVASTMQATNGIVIIARNGLPIDQSATIPRQAQQDYFNHYGRIDIWTPPTIGTPPLTLMLGAADCRSRSPRQRVLLRLRPPSRHVAPDGAALRAYA